MNKEQRDKFRELLLDQISNLPLYPSNNQSDTTIIAYRLCNQCAHVLYRLRILKGDYDNRFYPAEVKMAENIHSTVLRELNKMHKEGLVRKAYDHGGKSKGHNWTFIRWGYSGVRNKYPEAPII